jgi:glycosyltransferase involved in cell wall biosynthesis
MTAATGLRPYLGKIGRALLPLLAPDLYLSQARRWQRLFSAAGSRTADLPNGVDTRRFVPACQKEKRALKAHWNLPTDKPVVLHVGHVKPNRNLECLIDVQRSGRYQVWIIGSESESQPGPWRAQLEEAGCRVDTEFVPGIEQVYRAADAYVFTVRPTPPSRFPSGYQEVGVIDFPLSILEGMASGLPMITTRHDAVEHFLGNVAGLRYFDGTGADCLRQLDAVRGGKIETRQAAERFDVANVMGHIENVYRSASLSHRMGEGARQGG